MQIPFVNKQRNFMPGGRPRLNFQNPLMAGITGCYVPSAQSGLFIENLASPNTSLRLFTSGGSTAGGYIPTSEGHAMNCVTGNTGAGALAPSAMRPTGAASLYWRGQLTSSGLLNSNIGVTYTNTDSAPYFAYGIYVNITTIFTIWNSGGNEGEGGGVNITDSQKIISLGATFQQNGNVILYINGVKENSSSFGSSPIVYAANAQVAFCGYPPIPTRYLGGTGLIGMLWNRVLTPEEMLALHLNPYGHLIYPQDIILAEMSKHGPVATSQKHRHGVAG